ncbi:MAG: hypothetical protein HQL77_13360 [Magnetococcales bacterium]|nr:hypothetical protein [Magnetococcales bacterium]
MSPPSLRIALRSLVASQRPLKCYLGSFADGIHLCKKVLPGEKCSCPKLSDWKGRRKNLYQALEEARSLNADVVVFPELSICAGLCQELGAWLQDNTHPFCMVVPGSFHEEPDSMGKPINRTMLLDGNGREVFSHEKMIPMGTDKACYEVIRRGKRLHLLKTPLGLVALAICRDFLEDDLSISLPWQQIAPDWAIVPSMTAIQGIRAHKVRAKSLANCCGTRSLVPNQCPYGIFVENSHGFASWPDGKGDFHEHIIDPSSCEGRLARIPI